MLAAADLTGLLSEGIGRHGHVAMYCRMYCRSVAASVGAQLDSKYGSSDDGLLLRRRCLQFAVAAGAIQRRQPGHAQRKAGAYATAKQAATKHHHAQQQKHMKHPHSTGAVNGSYAP